MTWGLLAILPLSIGQVRRDRKSSMSGASNAGRLKREVGFAGAVLLGLGAIVGTGVFVSIGVAAGVAGPAVILAALAGGVVAAFNGLSSAQLAANHPVSGGTYEYGYRWLHPSLGFVAGWMFLAAKSASAATAALGCSGYLLHLVSARQESSLSSLAVVLTMVITALLCAGIRRSNQVNAIIVTVTLASLMAFVLAGLWTHVRSGNPLIATVSPTDQSNHPLIAFFTATALMFVAYTGYGRIATLGEEVHDPQRTIPQAIITTLVVSGLLYVAVAIVAVVTVGPERLASATIDNAAPLEVAAREFKLPWIATIVALGAVTAMLGVLLNLVLGLSRVVLAMARRGDLPKTLSRIGHQTSVPVRATLLVGLCIAFLCMIGSVKTTWTFSAVTVLIYYAITNASALALKDSERLYPRWISWCGLVSCLSLSFFIPLQYWLVTSGLVAGGFLLRWVMRSWATKEL